MRLMQNEINTEQQRRNGELLFAIGKGTNQRDADMISWDEDSGEKQFGISNLPFIHTEEEAMNFVYSNEIINPDYAIQRAFLAIANKDVDELNKKIKKSNPNEAISLFSKDNVFFF